MQTSNGISANGASRDGSFGNGGSDGSSNDNGSSAGHTSTGGLNDGGSSPGEATKSGSRGRRWSPAESNMGAPGGRSAKPGSPPPGQGTGRTSLDSMAKRLGYFSIGLGLAELLAPRAMARATGLAGRETLVRAYGLREIATGLGLLASEDPRPWLWGRVAGDALDALTLASRAGDEGREGRNAKLAILAAMPIVAIDLACARMADSRASSREGARFDYSDRVGMARPADEMRGAARDFMVPKDMHQPEPLRPYAAQ